MKLSSRHYVHATVAREARVITAADKQKLVGSADHTNDRANLRADAAFVTAVANAIKTPSARSERSWHLANEVKDYRMALLRVFVGFSACRLNVEDE